MPLSKSELAQMFARCEELSRKTPASLEDVAELRRILYRLDLEISKRAGIPKERFLELRQIEAAAYNAVLKIAVAQGLPDALPGLAGVAARMKAEGSSAEDFLNQRVLPLKSIEDELSRRKYMSNVALLLQDIGYWPWETGTLYRSKSIMKRDPSTLPPNNKT